MLNLLLPLQLTIQAKIENAIIDKLFFLIIFFWFLGMLNLLSKIESFLQTLIEIIIFLIRSNTFTLNYMLKRG